MTTLKQLIGMLDRLDREEVIYAAEPWTSDSEAACRAAPEQGDDAPAGLAYFLEVDLVHDVSRTWSTWRDGSEPTAYELTEAAIHYAVNDAYLPVEGAEGIALGRRWLRAEGLPGNRP